MPLEVINELFKYLHNCIFAIGFIFKILKANRKGKASVPFKKYANYPFVVISFEQVDKLAVG